MQKFNVCGHCVMQCCKLVAAWNGRDSAPDHVCRVLFLTRLLIRDCRTRTRVTAPQSVLAALRALDVHAKVQLVRLTFQDGLLLLVSFVLDPLCLPNILFN